MGTMGARAMANHALYGGAVRYRRRATGRDSIYFIIIQPIVIGLQRREHPIWQWTQSHWLCQPDAIMAIPINATLAPSQSVLVKSTPSTTLSQTKAVAT
ncbi:hypothetical protein KT71_001946 [Congregibacter litoralis KT71]|uniref:Uncharacterized protein n=1 Tax=Congregibacter litoralis KT71 TaxID=314285 RepID=V7HV46_9GAMM|nr:hypothetical protein KT71_001946 [Congregibacter litoralis KT71]